MERQSKAIKSAFDVTAAAADALYVGKASCRRVAMTTGRQTGACRRRLMAERLAPNKRCIGIQGKHRQAIKHTALSAHSLSLSFPFQGEKQMNDKDGEGSGSEGKGEGVRRWGKRVLAKEMRKQLRGDAKGKCLRFCVCA